MRQEVLPKGFGLQNEALMDEIPESQGSPGGLEREVAKWQNRMIPTLAELLSLVLWLGRLFKTFGSEFVLGERHAVLELGAV